MLQCCACARWRRVDGSTHHVFSDEVWWQDRTRDEEAKLAVENALVPIQNRMVIFFSELDPERTATAGSKAEIAEEVTELMNEVLGTDAIRRVYYTEFVIQ